MPFIEKVKNILLGAPDVEDYDDEDFFEEDIEDRVSARGRKKSSFEKSSFAYSDRSERNSYDRPNLTLVGGDSKSPYSMQMESYSTREMIASTISPKNCEEAMLIIDRIKQGNFVIFSLKNSPHQTIEELTVLPEVEEESKESVFKFICGGIYTLGAEITKFENSVFIAGPAGSRIDQISTEVKNTIKTTGASNNFRRSLF